MKQIDDVNYLAAMAVEWLARVHVRLDTTQLQELETYLRKQSYLLAKEDIDRFALYHLADIVELYREDKQSC